MNADNRTTDLYDGQYSTVEMLRKRWHGPAILLALVVVALAMVVAPRLNDLPAQKAAVEKIYDQGDYERFLTELDRFVRRYAQGVPDKDRLLYKGGVAGEELARGDMTSDPARQAYKYYAEALTGRIALPDGQRYRARLFLARMERALDRHAVSADHYSKLFEMEGLPPRRRKTVGAEWIEVLEAQTKRSEAVSLIRHWLNTKDLVDPAWRPELMLKLAELSPDGRSVYRDIVEAYPGTGHAARALVNSARLELKNTDPSDPALDAMIAEGTLGKGQLLAAEGKYGQAAGIAAGDHRDMARFGRGRCLEGLFFLEKDQAAEAAGYLQQALAEYEQLLKDEYAKSPYRLLAQVRKTRMRLNMEQTDLALDNGKDAIENRLDAVTESVLKQHARRMLEEDLVKLFDAEKIAENWGRAATAIELLRKVAPPAVFTRAEAELAATQASQLERILRDGSLSSPVQQQDAEAATPELYRKAAEGFIAAAGKVGGGARRLELLRRGGDEHYHAAEFLAWSGRVQEARKGFNDALRSYDEVLAGRAEDLADIDAPTVRLRAGMCLARTGRYADSIDRLKPNLVGHPNLVATWRSRVLIGRNFMDLAKYDEAAKVFGDVRMGYHAATEEVLGISIPSGADGQRVERPDPASQAWREALFGLAHALYHKTKQAGLDDKARLAALQEARSALDEYLDRRELNRPDGPDDSSPEIVRTRYALADTYRQLADAEPDQRKENLDAAIELYERVYRDRATLRPKPGSLDRRRLIDTLMELGACYLQAGSPAKALSYYGQCQSLFADEPESVQCLLYMAQCYDAMGQPARQRNERNRAAGELERLNRKYPPGVPGNGYARSILDHVKAVLESDRSLTDNR